MGQKVLTPTQKKIIKEVAKEKKMADFYLTGGTALAVYYFQHRVSDDLDFFSFDEPDTFFIHQFVNNLKNFIKAKEVRYERLHDRNQFYFKFDGEELKIEFTKYPFKQLKKPELIDGLKIDSLRDIGANKMMAALERFDPKDFVDLYFILHRTNLKKLKKDVEVKFGIKVDDIFLGGELAKARRLEALPRMLKPLTIEELKKFFFQQAKSLASRVLK